MTRLSFGILFVVLVLAEGYYHGDYYPEARHLKRRKGLRGDNGLPNSYEDVSRPHRWLRLKQRAEDMLEAYRRRRGYNVPYTRGTGYRGSRKRLRSNTYNQQTEYRRRNVYNQQTGYQKGPKTNVYDQQTGYRQRYNQQTGYQKGPKTNVYDQYKPAWQTQTYVKGPRTDSRGDEYNGRSDRVVYPQETVAETAGPVRGQREKERTRSTEYRQSSRNRNNRRNYNARSTQPPTARTTSGTYEGCKDTGLYCTFWKSIGCCEQPLGRKYCRRKCGFCSPQQTICPSSYKFGCCFDGKEAPDPYKSDCPECRDLSPNICRRPAIMKDCDLHEKNSLRIRSLCPQTCGACFDYATRA